jgi:mono/diheme cytochrome c family protein
MQGLWGALGSRGQQIEAEVSQAPAITPDPTRGAPLYAQHCSVCHGTAGAGDGPAATGMTPPPANLTDAARLDRLSLYAIYNTLGLGVEGTDMPSFADQLDDRQRWDLATYIAGFTAEPAAAKSEQPFNLADLARQTPNEVLAASGPAAQQNQQAGDVAQRPTQAITAQQAGGFGELGLGHIQTLLHLLDWQAVLQRLPVGHQGLLGVLAHVGVDVIQGAFDQFEAFQVSGYRQVIGLCAA